MARDKFPGKEDGEEVEELLQRIKQRRDIERQRRQYAARDEEADGGGDADAALKKAMPTAEGYKFDFDWKPRQLKGYLDQYVVGQEDAKKVIANAVCYHYARVRRALDPGEEKPSIKKNVLILGGTGVGKTYMVSKVAELLGVPWTKQDATRFSSTGYVGKDVDNMIRDLYLKAGKNLEAAEVGIVMLDEIDKIKATPAHGKDVNGIEVQHCLLKVMEETEVDLIASEDPLVAREAVVMREQDRQKDQRPSINTRHVLFIMSGAFPGLEEIVARRMERPEAISESDIDSSAFEGGWRLQVLPEDLAKYGFEAEFVSRLPVRVGMHDLNEQHLYEIMTRSKESIIADYKNDFRNYNIDVEFTDDAIKAIAEKSARHRTGARAIVTVMEQVMRDFMYSLPSTDIKHFVVTKEVVENPRRAHAELLAQYEMKRSYEDFAKYKEGFAAMHGIKLEFDKPAYTQILKVSAQTGKSVAAICDELLKKFPSALKLTDQTELVVTMDVLSDPNKYLRRIAEQYLKG